MNASSRRKYLEICGQYWSCPRYVQVGRLLVWLSREHHCPDPVSGVRIAADLEKLGCRKLKRRPNAYLYRL